MKNIFYLGILFLVGIQFVFPLVATAQIPDTLNIEEILITPNVSKSGATKNQIAGMLKPQTIKAVINITYHRRIIRILILPSGL